MTFVEAILFELVNELIQWTDQKITRAWFIPLPRGCPCVRCGNDRTNSLTRASTTPTICYTILFPTRNSFADTRSASEKLMGDGG